MNLILYFIVLKITPIRLLCYEDIRILQRHLEIFFKVTKRSMVLQVSPLERLGHHNMN